MEELKRLKKAAGYLVGSYNKVRKLQRKGNEAHHIIQNAAVRNLQGYSRGKAPTVSLSKSAHKKTFAVQRQKGGGTYASERRIAYKSLRRAGVSERKARKMIRQTDKYFAKLGVTGSTKTRIPGNRKR
ncbi:hypothetical protein ACT7C6_12860 [Bacillus paranthracis]